MKNIFKKNKKGADKVISVYWFLILIIVAGGIFAMVYTFYGAPYDVREIESDLLSNKIADCISRNGKLTPNLISEGIFNETFKNDFQKNCNLNFKTENEYDWESQEQYFFKISFYTLENHESSINEIFGGNLNFLPDCTLREDRSGKDYKELSKCTEKRFYSVDENKNQYLIKIISGVAKLEKNVKQ